MGEAAAPETVTETLTIDQVITVARDVYGKASQLSVDYEILEISIDRKAGTARVVSRVTEKVTINGLVIDAERRQVTADGRRVELTAKEFDLLWHFAQQPGRVFSRAQLLDQVWGYSFNGYEHTVNSHINRLRSKLEQDPANPHYIRTVWGVGYSLVEPLGDSDKDA